MQSTLPSNSTVDYLQYQYRPDMQLLVGRWQRQPTDTELQEGYFRLLEAAETHSAHLWLVDARRRDHATQQSTPWMMEHFLPLLPQRLGGPVFMAFVFMPTHLQEIERDTAVPPLTYFERRPYEVQRFTDEHAAIEWLSSRRPMSGPEA